MVQGRPEDNDPDGWYQAARMFDANRAANQAFHGVQRAVVPTPSTWTTLLISKMFPPAQTPFTTPPRHTLVYPGVPTRASIVPTPMEVDAARLRKPTPVLCRCCGEAGHFARDCPKTYDIRYMMLEEKETWIEQHLTAADVTVAEALSKTLETLEASEDLSDDPEQGFTSSQQVNSTPPLSSCNCYSVLDVHSVEDYVATSPNSSYEIMAVLDVQPTHMTHPSPPIRLPHWERRLPRKYVIASTPSANSLDIKVEIVTTNTQEIMSIRVLIDS